MKLIRVTDLPGVLPAKHYDLARRRITDESVGAKTMDVCLVRMEPSGRADPHIHEASEQLFIVLSGEMGIKTEQEEARLKEGEAVFIYPGELHNNYNLSDGETSYIIVTCKLNPEE